MMKSLLHKKNVFWSSTVIFPLFLLALCLAAYAPLITRLGFYWDDFPMAWIATTMGGDGLARYFSTNRPVWGLIYRLTTPLLGSRPITYQVFALLMRWISGLVLWGLLRQVWRDPAPGNAPPGRKQMGALADWAAALFVVYPGFSQQYISFVYSRFYIILTVFLLSLALMAWSLRLEGSQRRWFWPLTALSLLLSLVNLLSMEYFFLLDLLRPLLLWVILSDPYCSRHIASRGQRLRQVALLWLPYLAVFASGMLWRSVIFGFQTYQPALMSRLKAQPVLALRELIPLVLRDVWTASAGAWAKAFLLPDAVQVGARNMQRYWMLVTAGGLASAVYLLLFHTGRLSLLAPRNPLPSRGSKFNFLQRWVNNQAWAIQPVAIGITALFIAGGPFWLTDLQIGLVFPNDRFTLPFMLGASLVIAGLLVIVPLPRWSKAILLGAALGFAIGTQYQYAIDYNRDWSIQRSMFWQMVWRMPDIEPGTTLLSNELPVTHYTDNSLSAPLNWIYDPQNDPRIMQYMLFYPTLRKAETLSNFAKDRPVTLNYLATTFNGSTSQMVALYFRPPGCLRVLDPQIEGSNWMIPEYLRESLTLSTTTPIRPAAAPGKPSPQPPAQVFGAEIPRGWCYYYEKADLARQLGDWQAVVKLGDEAFAGTDYPNDPLERFPFIEGYAYVGNWNRSIELSREAYSISPVIMKPMLCRLWERIEKQGAVSETSSSIQAELGCSLGAK